MKKTIISGLSCALIIAFTLLTMSFKTAQNSSYNDCIYFQGNAYDDGECIASVTLSSSCNFLFINKEEQPHIRLQGTYSIDGTLTKGSVCTIKIYIEGEPTQYGTLAWGTEDGIHLLLGDYDFH